MHTQTLTHALVALVLAAGTAQAQVFTEVEAEPVEEVGAAEEGAAESRFGLLSTSLGLGGEYTFDADFKDVDSKVSIFRLRAGVDFSFRAGERGRFGVGLSEEYSNYDHDGRVFGSSAGHFEPHIETLTLRYTRLLSEDWWLMVLGDMTAAGEWDANFNDRLTYGGGALVSKKLNENLTLGVGAMAHTKLEDDTWVIPLINVHWRISDSWSLTAGRGVTLTYAFDQDHTWMLDINANYESRRFRLDDSHGGRLRDGIIEDERIPLTVGVTYSPSDNLKARLFTGAVLWQQFTAETDIGKEVGEEEADPAAMIGASVTFHF